MKLAKMPDGLPEIYDAVQGEGKTLGLPVIFVRLSNCNLSCHWCDTWYSWLFDDIYDGVKKENIHTTEKPVCRAKFQIDITPEEVAESIEKKAIGHKNVVFSGGEPLLQQDDMIKIIDILRKKDENWYFEIETNGTILIKDELAEILDQINSSPKLKSSGNNPLIKDRPEAIKKLVDVAQTLNIGLCFKFVIDFDTWESDLKEIKEWEKLHNIPRETIYLMPEGIDKERIEEGSRLLNEIAMKEGYKTTTRLQILLYGNKRAI